MSDHDLKILLKSKCQEYVDDRVFRIRSVIKNLEEALSSETKNTAGDKHETGRAMLQLEREKAGGQLAEVEKLQIALHKVETSKKYDTVSLGSVVKCTTANYYISISAGSIVHNSEVFFAIAPNTPIGQLLLGKRQGDRISFKDSDILIKGIL